MSVAEAGWLGLGLGGGRLQKVRSERKWEGSFEQRMHGMFQKDHPGRVLSTASWEVKVEAKDPLGDREHNS